MTMTEGHHHGRTSEGPLHPLYPRTISSALPYHRRPDEQRERTAVRPREPGFPTAEPRGFRQGPEYGLSLFGKTSVRPRPTPLRKIVRLITYDDVGHVALGLAQDKKPRLSIPAAGTTTSTTLPTTGTYDMYSLPLQVHTHSRTRSRMEMYAYGTRSAGAAATRSCCPCSHTDILQNLWRLRLF